MTDHPITPSPELVQQWHNEAMKGFRDNGIYEQDIATQAARWGSDQELNECCHLLRLQGFDVVDDLRAARRPKPPSLKEQALHALLHIDQGQHNERCHIIRRALEQLDD